MFRNPADLPKSKSPSERQETVEVGSKLRHELNNPCIKEQDLSMKCLQQNNYDKSACELVFQNYITCQKFWTQVKVDRRNKGITPDLPPPEQREKIKYEYLHKGSGSAKDTKT